MRYGHRSIFAPFGDAWLCTTVFRRFVVLRPPRPRLLREAPFGDSVRRMNTLSNLNPSNDRFGFSSEVVLFFSEVDEITSEIVLSFSEVILFCSEGVGTRLGSRAYTLHDTHVFCLHCLHHPADVRSPFPCICRLPSPLPSPINQRFSSTFTSGEGSEGKKQLQGIRAREDGAPQRDRYSPPLGSASLCARIS